MSPSKRIQLAGAILVLTAAALIALGSSRAEEGGALEGDRERAHELPDAMQADGPDARRVPDEDGPTPGLKGRAENAVEDAPAADTGGRVLEVHVLDRHKQPLPGVAVVIENGRGRSVGVLGRTRTDRRGIARFPGRRPEAVRLARALHDGIRPAHVDAGASWRYAQRVEDWVTTIECRVGMPFRVVCFDVETGAVLPEVQAGTGWLEEDGKRVIVGDTIAARPGGTLRGGFHLDVPEGYVAYEPAGAELPIAHGARSLLIHYPLHREADIEVTLRRQDGKPIRRPVEASFQFDHTGTLPLTAERVAAGRYRIRGLPFLPGQSIDMHITSGAFGVDWDARLPFAREVPLRASLTLSDDHVGLLEDAPFEGPANNSAIGIGGGPRPVDPPEPERGTLTVLCRLGDGSPARNQRVSAAGPWWSVQTHDGRTARGRYRRSGVTNAGGRVTFDGAAAGTWKLSFRDWHTATGEAVVQRGERTEVVLREPQGGSLVVTVVDGEDRPIPFARVGLLANGDHNAFRPIPDADGVQRIDDFTDFEGTRTLHRIAAGMHEITVRHHDQTLVVHVRIEEGETTHRKLVIER